MISQAIALSIFTFSGFYILYTKLPEKVKVYIKKYHLATDIATLAGAYILLGGTLTALFAAAMVGVMTSSALYIGNNREDFEYLWDFADMAKVTGMKVKAFLIAFGEDYRERKSQDA